MTEPLAPTPAAVAESWVTGIERAFRERDPGAFFVLPRVLRRVLRHELEITSPWVRVPHRKTYVVRRERLVWLVAMDELGTHDEASLPQWVVLIARPEEDQLAKLSATDLRRIYWRLLFHARIDAIMLERTAPERMPMALVRQRIDQIGQDKFDEIRSVLKQEAFLLFPDQMRNIYAEFVAVFNELRYFAPDLLPLYFPSIGKWDDVAAVIDVDCDPRPVLEAARPVELADADPAVPPRMETVVVSVGDVPETVLRTPSTPKYRRWLRSADVNRARGNHARAALYRQLAWSAAPVDSLEESETQRLAEIATLSQRLQSALELDDAEALRWRDALLPVLTGAAAGFWNANLRLLYDLQKVCVDHEREVYRVDLWRWVISGGTEPLKRPLPQMRTVLIAKHLRTASRRLGALRVDRDTRTALSQLLHHAAERAEELLRERLQPVVVAALQTVGAVPHSVVERVAFHKLSAELLDSVVQRGFLTLGHVRDAFSRSQLKLADLSGPREFLQGDVLLRADRELGKRLEGVYQRGPFYLRWLQRTTSLAFGTQPGRFITRFLALPFGGAFVALKGLHYLFEELHVLFGTPHVAVDSPKIILSLGLVLFVLMHGPGVREIVWTVMKLLWTGLKLLLIEFPRAVYEFPPVAWLVRSLPGLVFRRYLLSPLITALVVWKLLPLLGVPIIINRWGALGVLVVAFVVLNSRMGRDTEELVWEALARLWHRVRATVIIGLFNLIIDVFRQVMDALERVLYSVDEWLRFRSGDSVVSLWFKAVFGLAWSVVNAIVRFCVTLLIEPQINPIKHFPVVTVSHKLILPLGIPLTTVLDGFFDKYTAGLMATAIVTSVPGVFGFLAWEFKENWRLYAANRAKTLRPVIVGHHGETVLRLLAPGFHSGTIPKLFARRRRVARKTRHLPQISRQTVYEERLHHVAEAMHHFVDREFLGLIRESRALRDAPLSVANVALSTNRISVQIAHADYPETNAEILWSEQSGWLMASISSPGWIARFDHNQQQVIAAALAGLYHLASTSLVREHLEQQLGTPPNPYDITDQGLVVWPTRSFETEVTYSLKEGAQLVPRPRSVARSLGLDPIPASAVIFALHPLAWDTWDTFWSREATVCPEVAVLPDVTVLPS